MSHDDSLTMKVTIPALDLGVDYQNWRLSIEGVLMTKGLIRYIQAPPPLDAPVADIDKRTQAFGIILTYLSLGERLAINAILSAGTLDAHALWMDIKDRHEKVDLPRVWALWRRLNAPPTATLSDHTAINSWFTATVSAYNSYKTSGRQIDEYTACMIMLDNLPSMWDSMRRSITQAGNSGNTMTFAVLRGNMENELITRRPDQPAADTPQALLMMGNNSRQQHGQQRQQKRPRLQLQRTPGATCGKCKKPNHTSQQCGKTVDDTEQHTDGTLQLTASASTTTQPATRRAHTPTHGMFSDGYDSDEIHMTTGCNGTDDSSALATTKDSDFEPPSQHWLVDCGASHNYCNDRSLLSHVRPFNAGVRLGNGQRLPVVAEGNVTILLPPHGKKLTFTARYVPELRRNLLSAGALGRQGVHLLCAGQQAHIFHAQSGHEIGQARCINEGSEYNLYRIDPIHDTSPLHSALLACQSDADTEHDTVRLWHRRLGHSNVRRIRQLFTAGTTADGHALQHRIRPDSTQLQLDRHCDSCAICKHHAAPRPSSVPAESRAQRPLETIHIDLRGPHSPGIKQELYQLLIADESTRYAVGYTMRTKDEALIRFEQFATAAINCHSASGHSIKFIRSDNGGELIGADWTPLLTRLGIQRQLTSPYTPHQNGIVERLNRTIAECTRTMLHAAGLPERFWSVACQAAVYINNRLPSKATGGVTPYQLWHGKPPRIGHIRTFGCLAYALIHEPSIVGWNYNPKATTAGEAAPAGEAAAGEEQNRRALHEAAAIPSHIPTHTAAPTHISIAAHDSVSPASQPAVASESPASQLPAAIESPATSESPASVQPQPYSAQLNRAQQSQLRQLQDRLSSAAHDSAPAAQVTDAMLHSNRPQLRAGPGRHHFYGSLHTTQQVSDDEQEPRTYQLAMDSPHRDDWLAAIRSELNSLIKTHTWRYVVKPAAANLVGCKWVFKIKRDKDGSIIKFKARLVAQGFTQVYGIDYAETYAPVARYSSIRLIIALAAHYDWELHQMDVKTAYLNGELDVPIYMRAPDGLSLIGQTCPPDSVCLLVKSLYGLKQSGRRWHVNINQSLLSIGFTPLHADRCVYVRRKADCIDIIALYVDDLLIASSKISEMVTVKRRLTQQYDMEDMGEATFILGIDIRRERATRSISISQSAYLNTLLKRHGMADCNATSTPMEATAAHELMSAADGYEASPSLTRDYQSIIGGLMFAAICTRPDIAFAVNRLSRYCSNPTDAHCAAVKRILRYLKGTIDSRITYTGSTELHPLLIGYCDADWAQDKDCKRKSTTGYVFVVCGGAVSWQSKKQSTTALSSTEAELMAITSSTKELLWYRHHLAGIGLTRTQPTTLRVDSQCAIDIANNSRISDRSKHIEVQHFFVREHIEANAMKLQHVSSGRQVADTLTKPLPRVAFKRCADMLGLSQPERNAKVQRRCTQHERRGEVLERNGAHSTHT